MLEIGDWKLEIGVGDGDGVMERGREGEVELQATRKSRETRTARNITREIIAEDAWDYFLRVRPRGRLWSFARSYAAARFGSKLFR